MDLLKENIKISISAQAIADPSDNLLAIRISTSQKFTKYVVKATTEDDEKKIFASQATFLTDEQGVIDLTKHAPIDGDYEEIDSIGIFWSMRCKGKTEGRFVKNNAEPMTITLGVYENHTLLASEQLTYRFYQEDIFRKSIDEESIKGTLFSPVKSGSFPGVIIVGGSDASVHEAAAAMLATKGYVVLALAYFGQNGLPKGIDNIPLEYVDEAFQYLEKESNVDREKLGLIGFSRGAELALLYALHFPKLKSVIAVAPSAVVFSGVVNFQPIKRAAWTYQKKPLHYFKVHRTLGDTASFFYHWIFKKPYSGLPAIHRNLNDTRQLEENAIPVEKIDCPMMFLTGTDDHVQPAQFFSKQMEKRLKNHAYKHQNQFIYYEGAGHFAAFPGSLPNLPQTIGDTNYNMTMVFGGTRKVNAYTAQKSWEHTVKFLEETLKSENERAK